MPFPSVRKLLFQNTSSGNMWGVTLMRDAAGAGVGVARLLGLNAVGSDYELDNTEVNFVVRTTQLNAIFGATPKNDSYAQAAGAYNASDVNGAGTTLNTLLS